MKDFSDWQLAPTVKSAMPDAVPAGALLKDYNIEFEFPADFNEIEDVLVLFKYTVN